MHTAMLASGCSHVIRQVYQTLILLLSGSHKLHVAAPWEGTTKDWQFKKNMDSYFQSSIVSDDIDTLRSLISSGVDVNSGGCYGTPPIFGVIVKNNVEMIQELLGAGADPSDQSHPSRQWCPLSSRVHPANSAML